MVATNAKELREVAEYTLEDYGGCIEWDGGAFTSGYGSVYYEGKARRAHRLVYEFFSGDMSTPTIEQQEAFLTDLLAVYNKHGLSLYGGGPSAAVDEWPLSDEDYHPFVNIISIQVNTTEDEHWSDYDITVKDNKVVIQRGVENE